MTAYASDMELPVDLVDLVASLRAQDVVFAVVFGSHARGEARDDSDVDLGYWRGDSAAPLAWGVPSGIDERVEAVDLRTAPLWLAGRAAVEGVVVLDDDAAARVRWQADTRKRWADERFRRERFQQDVLAAIRG